MTIILPPEYSDNGITKDIAARNIYGRRAVPLPTEKGYNFCRITDPVRLPSGGSAATILHFDLRYKMRTNLPPNKLVCLNFTIHAVNHSGAIIASRQITDTSDENSWPNYWITEQNGETDFIKIQNGNTTGVESAFKSFVKQYGFNPQVKQFILTFEPTNFKGAQTGYVIHDLTVRITFIGVPFNLFEYDKPGVVPAGSLPRVSSLNVSDRIKVGALWRDVAPELAPKMSAILFVQKNGQPLESFSAQLRKSPQWDGWGEVDNSFVEGYVEIPPNTLKAGETEMLFWAKAEYQEVGWLGNPWRRKIVQLVDTRPTITTLEPGGVVLNVENPIPVTWTSTDQETFTLIANGKLFSGTTEKAVLIPGNTFRKGENTIKLTAKNSTAEFAEVSKTVTFTGYGRPSLPVLEAQTVYNTAKPTFRWTTDEQHSYHIRIYRKGDLVKDSGTVVSGDRSYTSPINLQNNADYTIKLRVKNDKGLWSDEAVKTIRISFSELKPATLMLYGNDRGAVTVNVTNPTDATFSHCEVWRKRSYDTEWVRIAKEAPLAAAFTDPLLAADTEYQYKVISYNKQGGGVESAIKSVVIEVPEMEFIDLRTMEVLSCGYAEDPDEPFECRRVQERQLMQFEGLKAPVIEIGEIDHKVLRFKMSFKRYADLKRFEIEADRAKLLLFRSTQGHLHFGLITDWGSEKISATGITSIEFTFTEMAFTPGEIYVAGKQVGAILTDQGYTFGG